MNIRDGVCPVSFLFAALAAILGFASKCWLILRFVSPLLLLILVPKPKPTTGYRVVWDDEDED